MNADQAIAAYRTWNPSEWVGVYQLLPLWAGLVAVAMGAWLLLLGGGRPFRWVASPVAGLLAFIASVPLAQRLGLPAEPYVAWLAMLAVALLGLLFPSSVVFLALGIPSGLLAGLLAGPQDFLLGFLPAFLVGGALAGSMYRYVAVLFASTAGSWLVTLGLLTTLHPLGMPVEAVVSSPHYALLLAGVLALGGSVYQLVVRPSPQEQAAQRAARHRLRQREREKKALERRWVAYARAEEKERA